MIITDGLYAWRTGDLLTPTDLTNHYDHLNTIAKDVHEVRYARSSILFQLVQNVNTPIQESDYTTNAERCRFRIQVPVTIQLIELHAFANYTASAGINISLYEAGGNAPPNLRNPIIELPESDSAADEITSQAPFAVYLVPGSSYYIEVAPATAAGTMSIDRMDLSLMLKSDRLGHAAGLNLDGYNYDFQEGQPPDAIRVRDLNQAFTATAADLSVPNNAVKPIFVQCAAFSGAASNITKFDFPSPTASYAPGVIKAAYFAAVFNSASTDTATSLLTDEAGSTQLTQTTSASSAAFKEVFSSGQSIALSSTAGPSSSSGDYRIAYSSSGSDTVFRGYTILWVSAAS